MKARNLLILIMGSLLFPIGLNSCGEDRWAAYAGQTETDRWIDDTLRVWYYWREDIPESDRLNYFSPPFTFFKSMLSREDRFSFIDSLHTDASARSIAYTDHSYGMEFAAATVKGLNRSRYLAPVLCVAKGTPADECGLRRGDWICSMNGAELTKNNIKLLYGSEEMQIVVGHYDAEADSIVDEAAPRTLKAARSIDDNPVHYASVISTPGGHRVGYLVYNHFTAGAGSGTEYNDCLRQVIAQFAAQQIDDLVLDLRYNNGGLVTCAQLLATMLVPQAQLDQPMAYSEYNERVSSKHFVYNFDSRLIGSGANLNLSRLFILTGTNTASASELVINCLNPFMEVNLIGANTVGKNVGSVNFKSERLMITMNPIVCKLYNAEMFADYEKGFTPTHKVNEFGNLNRFLPFGHPEEALLNKALSVIDGTEDEPDTRAARGLQTDIEPQHFSVERHATGAVVIR